MLPWGKCVYCFKAGYYCYELTNLSNGLGFICISRIYNT